MKQGRNPTKARNKNENHTKAFDWARDMGYTVAESKTLAREATVWLKMDDDKTHDIFYALRAVLFLNH